MSVHQGEPEIDTDGPYPVLRIPGNDEAYLQMQFCYDLREWR